MADMQSALVARLSTATGGKGFWSVIPQDTQLPYVRFQTISDDRPQDLDGYEVARETRVQVDCFAKTYKAARQMAEAIIAATTEPAIVAGIVFGRIKAEGPRDLGEDTATGFVHRASLDLLVWHRQA